MKLNKIISAVSAFAMAISMVTVANAASLGGKPTVKATFDSYEKVSDTVAFAYVNVTLDMTAAEALEAYSNELDEITWEEVIKGNGITTLGTAWSTPAGFTYTKAKSIIPTGLSVNATTLTFGPKTNAEEYWVEPTTTIKLALRVNDFDAKGNFAITNATVDGKNSAEGAVWSYSLLGGTIAVEDCSIPSYNEWSAPDEPEVTTTLGNAVAGNDMYGQKTIAAGISFATGSESKATVTLMNGATEVESKEYSLPGSGVAGGTTNLVGIIRYNPEDVTAGNAFKLTVGEVSTTAAIN